MNDRIDILPIDGKYRAFINGGSIVNRKGEMRQWETREQAITWLQKKAREFLQQTGQALQWFAE